MSEKKVGLSDFSLKGKRDFVHNMSVAFVPKNFGTRSDCIFYKNMRFGLTPWRRVSGGKSPVTRECRLDAMVNAPVCSVVGAGNGSGRTVGHCTEGMAMVKKVLFAAAVVASVTLAGCFGWWGGSSTSRDSVYDREPVGSGPVRSAPSAVRAPGNASLFRLPMIDGQPVTVKSPAMLFFFTSWCGYCKQVLPQFRNVVERARSQGWRVYGIDVGEGPQKANEFVQQFNPNFPVLVDQQSMVARRYGVSGYPTFVVIDENANIIYNAHELPTGF